MMNRMGFILLFLSNLVNPAPNDHPQRSTQFHVAARPRAARKCSQRASYHSASDEIALYDETDLPACDHMQLPPPAPVATVPMIDPCPGSSDSVRPGCGGPDRHPPTLSRDEKQARFCDKVSETQ